MSSIDEYHAILLLKIILIHYIIQIISKITYLLYPLEEAIHSDQFFTTTYTIGIILAFTYYIVKKYEKKSTN